MKEMKKNKEAFGLFVGQSLTKIKQSAKLPSLCCPSLSLAAPNSRPQAVRYINTTTCAAPAARLLLLELSADCMVPH